MRAAAGAKSAAAFFMQLVRISDFLLVLRRKPDMSYGTAGGGGKPVGFADPAAAWGCGINAR